MKLLFGFLFCVLIYSSCTKDELNGIKFNSPGRAYNIVIEGGINTLQKTQFIKLTEPTYDVNAVSKPATGAKVSVNDGMSTIQFKETATPGIYSGVVQNNTNYNKAYKLNVTYKNKEYTAVDTLRQVVNIIDDFLPLGASKVGTETIRINIPKHTFGFLNSCKWIIAYNGSPLYNPEKFDSTQNYSYTHTQGSPNSIYPLINKARVSETPLNNFVTIYKFSLSEEYAKYLYAIFQETDWKGIFSSSPSEIKGNISEGGLGFFYVIDVDRRVYRARDLVP